MCLVAVAWRCHARYPLVLAANRDELYERPTRMAAVWQDAPEVLGGRDLQAGGSWLALSRRGRLAAVTNVRLPGRGPATRSRGALVREFVMGESPAAVAAAASLSLGDEYGPYNLLLWDGRELLHASNHPEPSVVPLPSGIHGLSNGPIDAPWPKVRRLTAGLRNWLDALPDTDDPDPTPLFAALADERGAPDDELPDTGVGIELERRLAPAFIRDAHYGTRASSVVLIRDDGQAMLLERNFAAGGTPAAQARLTIRLEGEA